MSIYLSKADRDRLNRCANSFFTSVETATAILRAVAAVNRLEWLAAQQEREARGGRERAAETDRLRAELAEARDSLDVALAGWNGIAETCNDEVRRRLKAEADAEAWKRRAAELESANETLRSENLVLSARVLSLERSVEFVQNRLDQFRLNVTELAENF